jgi:predicted dehydrogenase
VGPLRRVRLAVVGLGGISQSVHLPLLRRRWDLFELAALVDLSATRTADLAARYGVGEHGTFRTLEELLAARARGEVVVDAVLVATTGRHAAPVCQALTAGLPVLAEKPLALCLADIEAIEAAARAAGADPAERVMVGYMKEFDPATKRARQELDGATLRAVTVEVLHPADAAQLGFARLLPPPADVSADVTAALSEHTDRAVDRAVGALLPPDLRAVYANVVLGSVIHDISLLRCLVDGVETVETATRWGGHPGSLEVTGTVTGGARLHIGWHFIPNYPDYRETVTFHHERGSLRLQFPVPYLLNAPTDLTVVSRTADETAPGEVRTAYRWTQQEAFEQELLAFHAMVLQPQAALAGTSDSRRDLEVAQRVLAALAHSAGAEVGGEAGRHRAATGRLPSS